MSQPHLSTVVFDWGGVFLQTKDRSGRIAWDDRLGLPHGSVESVVHGPGVWIQAQLGRISPRQYWDMIASELGITSEQVRQLAFYFYRGDALDTDLVDMLLELRNNGIRTALLSNFSIELKPLLDCLYLAPFFEVAAISAEIGVMKPQADAYLHVTGEMGIEPNQAVFIDDRQENIVGARAIGMQGVLYQDTLQLRKDLFELGLPIAGA